MSFDLNVYGTGNLISTEDLIFGIKNAFANPYIDPEIELKNHEGFLPISWDDPFNPAKRIEGGIEVDFSVNGKNSWDFLLTCGGEKHELMLCWLIAGTIATRSKGQLYDNQTGESFEGHFALWRAYKEIKVQKLLPYSYDVNAFGKLHDALMSNKIKKLKKALKSSKNVFALNDGGTQILNYYMGGPHYFEYDPKEVIDLMMSFSLSINHNSSYRFMTDLDFACTHKNLDLIKYLIEKGADVNFPNEQWYTPLFGIFESFEGEDVDKEIIKMLISAGADVHLKNHEGMSPLDLAIERAVKLDNGKGKKTHDLRPVLSELNISVNTDNQDFGIKIFWWDAIQNEGPSTISQAKVEEVEVAINRLNSLSKHEDSFLGVVLTDDSVIQFGYDNNGKLNLDIPDTEKEGSYKKQLPLQEAINLIDSIYQGKDPKNTDNLIFDSWK